MFKHRDQFVSDAAEAFAFLLEFGFAQPKYAEEGRAAAVVFERLPVGVEVIIEAWESDPTENLILIPGALMIGSTRSQMEAAARARRRGASVPDPRNARLPLLSGLRLRGSTTMDSRLDDPRTYPLELLTLSGRAPVYRREMPALLGDFLGGSTSIFEQARVAGRQPAD